MTTLQLLPSLLCLSLPLLTCTGTVLEVAAVDDGGSGPADGPSVPADGPPGATVPPKHGGSSTIPKGGKGAGNFRLAWSTIFSYADAAKAVPQLADLNGDGKPDIVMNPRKVGLIFYLGKGDGKFTLSPTSFQDPFFNGWGPDTGDIDGDGDIDVAVGDHNKKALAFRNDGSGRFTASSSGLPIPMEGLSGCGLGDFNGDGRLDYVGGSDQFAFNNGKLYMALGKGDGTWTTITPEGLTVVKSNLGHVFTEDLDGDGDLDIVASSNILSGGSQIYANVLINQGGGQRWTSTPYGPHTGSSFLHQLSIADVNGDGKPDLAVGGSILLNDGHGKFSSGGYTVSSSYNHFGDMDGDGKMDLVVHDRTIGLQLYLGDGTGRRWTKTDVGLGGPVAEAFGIDVWDLDGNGALDIIRVFRVDSTPQQVGHNAIETWVR